MTYSRILIVKIFGLLFLISAPSFLKSQNTWTEIGKISSGTVRCFSVYSDSLIFAGCDDGLFLSSDYARTWKWVSSFPSISVYSIIGGYGSILTAGTANGIYRSDDGGKSWSGPIPGTKDYIVLSITTLPDGEFLAGSFKKGILISTDHGMLWKEIFSGHTIQSFVSTPDGIIYCISEGKNILCAKGAFDRWEEFKNASINNLPLMTLYTDGKTLYAGTAEGAYAYSDGSTGWEKILDKKLITGISKNEDQILFYATEENGMYSFGGKTGSKEYTEGCPYKNIMCLGVLKGRSVIIGTTDGRIAVYPSYDSTIFSSAPLKKTWQNSFFSLGLAFGIAPVTSLSIGLAAEIKPVRFLSVEAIPNVNLTQGNFTFQARGKIYPFTQLGLFFGGGYYHAGSYGGGHGVVPPLTEYCDYSGHEFFIGYRFPRVIRFEFGYRKSDAPWRVVYGLSGGYSEDYTYMKEWFLTTIINLFSL